MSDKWDEIARNILRNMSIPAPYFEMPLADALRQAFAEGERAGMERAAVIADATEDEWANQTASYWEGMRGRVEVPPPSLAIRAAAKEIE